MNYLAKMENKSSKSQRRLGEFMKIPVYLRFLKSPVNTVEERTISGSVNIFIKHQLPPTPSSCTFDENMTPLSKNNPTCAKYWVIFKQFNILINIL